MTLNKAIRFAICALMLVFAFQNCGELQSSAPLQSLKQNVSGNGGGYFGKDPLENPGDPPPDNPGGGFCFPGPCDPILVYRAKNTAGDYLFSTSENEASQLGYNSDGVAFSLLLSGREIFRCVLSPAQGAGRFLSYSPSCEGHLKESSLGFARSAEGDGYTKLVRCFVNGHHLATKNEMECAGASSKVILGYVAQ